MPSWRYARTLTCGINLFEMFCFFAVFLLQCVCIICFRCESIFLLFVSCSDRRAFVPCTVSSTLSSGIQYTSSDRFSPCEVSWIIHAVIGLQYSSYLAEALFWISPTDGFLTSVTVHAGQAGDKTHLNSINSCSRKVTYVEIFLPRTITLLICFLLSLLGLKYKAPGPFLLLL